MGLERGVKGEEAVPIDYSIKTEKETLKARKCIQGYELVPMGLRTLSSFTISRGTSALHWITAFPLPSFCGKSVEEIMMPLLAFQRFVCAKHLIVLIIIRKYQTKSLESPNELVKDESKRILHNAR